MASDRFISSSNPTFEGTTIIFRFSIYDININKPEFELVKMLSFKSKGSYDGENLQLKNAYAKNENGYLSASRYIPFDLNIGSDRLLS